MKTREMTCIVCPMGCQMTITLSDDGSVESVRGNTCPRGKNYAVSEMTHPVRTLTTTARTDNGGLIPVKTARAIPKELLFDAMKVINDCVVALPAEIGDVLIEDLLGTGIPVIVTANRNKSTP